MAGAVSFLSVYSLQYLTKWVLNNLNCRHKFDLITSLQVISLSVTDEKIIATDKITGDKVTVSHKT